MTQLPLTFSYDKTVDDWIDFIYAQPDIRRTFRRYQPKDFCLKVLGKEEYLLEDVPLSQYKVTIHYIVFL